MPIPTKTARTLQASATNTAGSTTTGTALDLTTKFGGLATLVVTNGGTGPTVACDAILETSRDNTNWYEFSRQTAGVTASTTYTFNVEIPIGIMYLRSKFTSNTAQSVTVEGYFQEVTSIA
jgi:hypothetical protein